MAVTMDFTYRREGCRTFPEMLEAVERAVHAHGFEVMRRHDLQAALAAKGFEIQPLVVLDIAASDGTCDLCKMHVYTEGDIVWVSAIRPFALWQDIDEKSGTVAADAEASVRSLIDAACD